jgi:hypothetical protein
MKRFGNDLISPQHLILEPDGDLAYRKEYFEHVVGPRLLDTWLSRLSPPVAYARANIDRAAQIEALSKTPDEGLASAVETLLRTVDGLGVVTVLSALDEDYDDGRRLTIIRALASAPAAQAPALAYGADERVGYPQDQPEETRAWLATLFAVDRGTAAVAAARALARTEDAEDRDALLRIWGGVSDETSPKLAHVPAPERALALEALILAGDVRARDEPDPKGLDEDMIQRLARARTLAGFTTGGTADIEAALKDGRPGVVYRALLEASPDEVRTHETRIRELAGDDHCERVRVAAALALLAGGAEWSQALGDLLVRSVFDPVEGPDTRLEAVARLGMDPGQSVAEWQAALGPDR